MERYVLNLNVQSNGDYEVHKENCRFFPSQNYVELGRHISCITAVNAAKRMHPFKKINGCIHCSDYCHTS